MTLTVDHAHFVAIWFEALLYGVYFCLFISCSYVLYTRPVNGRIPKVMLSAMLLMFLLNTAHVGGTLRNVEVAMFERGPGEAVAYLTDRSQPLNVLNKALYAFVSILGDGLLIYRCWIIWQKNFWAILAPAFFLLATSASGIVLVAFYAQLQPGQSVFAGQLAILTPATLALSLICNLLTTGLIVYRIRTVTKQVQHSSGGASQSALRTYKYSLAVIIESGAIYPISIIVAAVLFLTGSNVQAVFTGAMCQIIGIVPTLAILQVRLGLSRYDAAQTEPPSANAITGTSRAFPQTPRSDTFGSRAHSTKVGAPEEYDLSEDISATSRNRYSMSSDLESGRSEESVVKESEDVGGKVDTLTGRPMSIHFQRTVICKTDSIVLAVPQL